MWVLLITLCLGSQCFEEKHATYDNFHDCRNAKEQLKDIKTMGGAAGDGSGGLFNTFNVNIKFNIIDEIL